MIDLSWLTANNGSGNTGATMDEQSNSQSTAHQPNGAGAGLQVGGGTHQQQQQLDGSGGNFGANASLSPSMFQPQQEERNSPDSNNHNNANNGGANNANTGALNISNEIKRLQQLHQLGAAGGNPSNALLMNPGSTGIHDPATAAFLQSMLAADSQQKANQGGTSNSNRFESALTGGGAAGNMLASNNSMSASTSGDASSQNNAMNSMAATMQLPSNFLNDARLLMAQNQMFQNAQGGVLPFAMMPPPPQQQQSQDQQQLRAAAAGANPEMPLPSPHSLFHRDGSRRMRGGVIEPFPEKLHRLLTEVEAAGRSDVISFVASGRAFAIHKPDKFFKEIVPLYFRQSRLSSFKRQLNLYGFELINTGPARGGYYHELFVKDRPELCRRMRRVAVKVGSDAKKGGKTGDPTAAKPNAGDDPAKQQQDHAAGDHPDHLAGFDGGA